MARLGSLQRTILTWLDTAEAASARRAPEYTGAFGVYYAPALVWPGVCTHAESAARSLALRNLEARGFVRRLATGSGDRRPRTNYLKLTDAGRAAIRAAVKVA